MDLRTGDSWRGPELHTNPSAASPPAIFELRPLTLGEVLDRTFSLYRARFWLFAGIAAVPATVQVVVQAISLSTTRRAAELAVLTGPSTDPAAALRALGGAQWSSFLAGLLFLLLAAMANAATTLALSDVYLGRPIDGQQAWRLTLRHWFRWIAIGLWLLGSFIWLPLVCLLVAALLAGFGAATGNAALRFGGIGLIVLALLGGMPAGFVLYLRNCLAIPAALVEHLGVRAAMRRSKALAAGTKGRIFVVLLIAGVLYLVVGALQSPASFLMVAAPRQTHVLARAIALIIAFLGQTLVAPVGLIGLTLIYFDQRVRNEALDLQLLLQSANRRTAGLDTVSAAPDLHG